MLTINISLVISVAAYPNVLSVTENGKSLTGIAQKYLYNMLYFHNRVGTKFHGYSMAKLPPLHLIRNGDIDFTGNFESMKFYGDPVFLNSYNAGSLGVNTYEQCIITHKVLFGKTRNVDLLQNIVRTHNSSEFTVLSLLILILLIYLIPSKPRSGKNPIYLFSSNILSKITSYENFFKKTALMCMIGTLTSLSFLLNAFFATDSISFDKEKTFDRIEDLEKWKFAKLLTFPNSCDTEITNILKSYNLENFKNLMFFERDVGKVIAENKPGLVLVATRNVNSRILYWFYCHHNYQDCQNHFMHSSKSFGYAFGTRFYRKDLQQRKLHFLMRYAYSNLENGMWKSSILSLQKDNLKEFGYGVLMLSERKQKQEWMPLSFKFMSKIFGLFLAFSLFALIVFITIELYLIKTILSKFIF